MKFGSRECSLANTTSSHGQRPSFPNPRTKITLPVLEALLILLKERSSRERVQLRNFRVTHACMNVDTRPEGRALSPRNFYSCACGWLKGTFSFWTHESRSTLFGNSLPVRYISRNPRNICRARPRLAELLHGPPCRACTGSAMIACQVKRHAGRKRTNNVLRVDHVSSNLPCSTP
jgi:hypothetical protein